MYNPLSEDTETSYTLWVSDLSVDVSRYALYKYFAGLYNIKLVRVIHVEGKSAGYGYVKFMNKDDMVAALSCMQGHTGLGSNPLRVSLDRPGIYNVTPG